MYAMRQRPGLDNEESRREQTSDFQNKMPKKDIECKMATENQEQRNNEKNGNKYQYRLENYPEKVELLWSHMHDER